MQKAVAEKRYYRPDEVALMADVSVATVRRWMKRELIRHVHLVGRIRIPSDEVERILRDGIQLCE